MSNFSINKGVEAAGKLGMTMRTFNQCCNDGASLADPRDLYDGLLYEGEVSALYADTNLGKTIFAVQIGEHIANMGIPTAYIDLEMSDKGIEKRSRDPQTGAMHVYPDNLLRLTFDMQKVTEHNPEYLDDELAPFDYIEGVCREAGVKVIIIDNITAISAGVESGDTAVRLVNRLLEMRDTNKWTILFIAHTPKIEAGTPISRDSMSGSKRVISLIDSAFAVGQPLTDPGLRYIKQTKVRQSEFKYHENNVLLCRIGREDNILRFLPIGTDVESNLLSQQRDRGIKNEKEVLECLKQGFSYREAAEYCDVSKQTVERVAKKYRNAIPSKN